VDNNGTGTQNRASLTNTAQMLLAANANRKYLLVQNNDASAYMRITLDGSTPSATAGFRVSPGGSMEMSNYTVSGMVKAIMETATAAAANVEFMEGM
jgi:hypothetical protein